MRAVTLRDNLEAAYCDVRQKPQRSSALSKRCIQWGSETHVNSSWWFNVVLQSTTKARWSKQVPLPSGGTICSSKVSHWCSIPCDEGQGMFQEVSSSPFQQLPVVQEKERRKHGGIGWQGSRGSTKEGNNYVIKMVKMTSETVHSVPWDVITYIHTYIHFIFTFKFKLQIRHARG